MLPELEKQFNESSLIFLILSLSLDACHPAWYKQGVMKKWIPLLLFLVFAHDMAIDAFDADCDADCQDKAGAAICPTCVCQTHFVNPVVGTQQKLSVSAEYVPSPEPALSLNDFSKSFFHPPKALA